MRETPFNRPNAFKSAERHFCFPPEKCARAQIPEEYASVWGLDTDLTRVAGVHIGLPGSVCLVLRRPSCGGATIYWPTNDRLDYKEEAVYPAPSNQPAGSRGVGLSASARPRERPIRQRRTWALLKRQNKAIELTSFEAYLRDGGARGPEDSGYGISGKLTKFPRFRAKPLDPRLAAWSGSVEGA